MKFLVLALSVCAASAANFGTYKPVYNPGVGTPIAVAKAVVNAPVFATEFAANTVVPAAKTAYQTSAKTFVGNEAEAPVLRAENEVSATGYNYVYETGNGITAQATGALKRVGDSEVLVSQGTYRYVAPDGTPVEFTYVADENGYQPQSNLIPVAPPVPEPIARALAYIAAHPPAPVAIKQY